MSISISQSTPVQAPQKNKLLEATEAKPTDKTAPKPADNTTTQPAGTTQAFTNALGQVTGTKLSVKA